MNKKVVSLICIIGVTVLGLGGALREPAEDNAVIQDEIVDVVEMDATEPVDSYTDNNNTSYTKAEATTPTIIPTPIVEEVQADEAEYVSEDVKSSFDTDNDTQSYYEKGRELGQEVKEYLQDIDWDEKQEKAREAGKEAAEFINGLLK